MSFGSTPFRPLTRSGWGGRAASHFRGLLSDSQNNCLGSWEFPQAIGASWRGQIGTEFVRSIGARVNFILTGVTRDGDGAAVGGVTVDLFLTATDTLQRSTVSGGSGNFSFAVMSPGLYYIVAYKAGSPDIAGTTVNTLTHTAV